MSKLVEKSLVVRKENLYEKIRKSLFAFLYAKDYQMMEKLDELIKPKRPNKRIVIPQEMGKNIKKWNKEENR